MTNFRIPTIRDPRVKPEDDIVGNSRIPRIKSKIPRINLEFLRINLEFLRMNLEFLEIASLRSQ